MLKRPITAVIVGAGHRAMISASYAKKHPEELQIVGVAEPNDLRRNQAAEMYNLSPEFPFGIFTLLPALISFWCAPRLFQSVITTPL